MNLNRIEKVIEFFAIVFMTIILAIFIRALIAGDTKGEANTGDFGSSTFNEGWRMEGDDPDGSITLPADVAAPRNEMIVIRNILPDDISDGMIMLFRTSIEDIYDFLNANKEMKHLREHPEKLLMTQKKKHRQRLPIRTQMIRLMIF